MAIIFLIVDYLISYYLPGNTSLVIFFSPCFFISLIITYIYFLSDKEYTFYFILLLGIIYDLLFSNTLFLYLISFYLLFNLISYIKRKVNISYFSYLFILVISIIFNMFINYSLLFIMNLIEIDISKLLILVFRNILSSLIFSFIFYYFFKKIVIKHIKA